MDKIFLKINHFFDSFNFIEKLEKIPNKILIATILSLCYLSFVPNGNEEVYLQISKQFYNPNWIYNSQTLNEFPGSRIIYQYITGFFLQFLSFECFVFIFRILFIIIISLIIDKIYKQFNISKIQTILHLGVLFIANQSFFAGSWMLISIEPKGFAYVFVLLSIYHLLRNNYSKMFLFLMIGTYFHILAGGYAFGYMFLALLLTKKNNEIKTILKNLLIYIIPIIPLFIYIIPAAKVTVNSEVDINWIFTNYRNPHHTAIFKNFAYFYKEHFYGVVLSIIGLYFSIRNNKNVIEEKFRLLNNFVILSLIGVLFFVIVAFFDKNGVILKYYPFRINTLTTFILTIFVTKWIFNIISKEKHKLIYQYIFLFTIMMLLKTTVPNIISQIKYLKNKELISLSKFVKKETKKDAVIFSINEDLVQRRKLEREHFIMEKHVSSNLNDLPEWYNRVLTKKEILNNFSKINDATKKYKIDYIVSKNKIEVNNIQLIYSNKKYFLYKIKINS